MQLPVLPPDPPACVGGYEQAHAICDGDPDGKTDFDRRACLWRDRCAGLLAYATEFELETSDVVAGQDPASLARMCDEHVVRYAVKDGIVGGLPAGEAPVLPPRPADDPDDAVPAEPGDVIAAEGEGARSNAPKRTRRAPKRKKKGERSSSRYTVPLNDDVLELAKHFERQLRKHFKKCRFRPQRSKRVLARPGTIFAIDRTTTSRYVSWYQLPEAGRDQAIACVRFKPALKRIDVELPVTVDVLRTACASREFKLLRVHELNDGQFRCVCTHLDAEGTALVVEAIARLANHGKIRIVQGR